MSAKRLSSVTARSYAANSAAAAATACRAQMCIRDRKGSFRRAAAGMLQNTSGLAEASVQVVFDDEGMKVITQDSTRTVPYLSLIHI